ncbi:MAG TPA: Na-translocating system protein MpsC family protein [Solirubrobacteraceae bacterium]|nr:Na-translocating system protein MpsC family protein [Solirubrobacteraceae bacterium]
MSKVDPPARSEELTRKISSAMVALYAEVYGHDRTTATTYINDDVVVCILEDILSFAEQELVAAGGASEVIEGRVAFQTDRQDAFSAAVERLTRRRVVAFLSANQSSPGIACELFFLEPASGPPQPGSGASGDAAGRNLTSE